MIERIAMVDTGEAVVPHPPPVAAVGRGTARAAAH